MRIPNKKLGLVGTLIAAGGSLIGCGKPVPEQVDQFTQGIGRYDTAMEKVNYTQGTDIDKAAAEAKEQNTRRLKSQREEDLKPIYEAKKLVENFSKDKAEFDKLCEGTLFTSPVTSSPVAPSSVPTTKSLLVAKKDSATEVYVSADQRLDNPDVPVVIGAGIRYRKGNGYVNLEADSMSTTVSDTSHNLTLDKTGIYLSGGGSVRIGKYELSLGLGVTNQTANIYGQNGVSTVEDTQSDNFLYGETGIKCGKKNFCKLNLRQGIGGDKRSTSGASIQLGRTF